MEKYDYDPVSTENVTDVTEKKQKLAWKPLLRQLMICSGLWTAYFMTGLSLGSPTVMIPQMRRANHTIDDEMASWLSSALSYSALPWVVMMPLVMHHFGRKKPFILICCAAIVSFSIFYAGTTTTHFIISQTVQGILFSANLTVSIVMVTEYTSPQYRGMFLTIKSASVFWGMWASNAIGTFASYNYIGLFGLICAVPFVSVFAWPESPYWLASKGRFEECARAHRWLKGVDKDSERELHSLISSQREHVRNRVEDDNCRDRAVNFTKTMSCTEFYKPILLSILVMAQFHASGKIVCSMYSIELIKKITDSESTAYMGMLILDGVSVAGMYFGCSLSKVLRRRTLLLYSSVIGITFLFTLSGYLWLVKLSVVSENKVYTLTLLSAFFVTISCGPMIMSTSIYAELIPLRFKSSAVLIIVFFHSMALATSLKAAPFIFRTISLQGTFAFYGSLAGILTFFIYRYLPETKDKSLQEIEELFRDKKETTDNTQEKNEINESKQ